MLKQYYIAGWAINPDTSKRYTFPLAAISLLHGSDSYYTPDLLDMMLNESYVTAPNFVSTLISIYFSIY
jgi:hypothetical protein